jgi:glutathione S-transferase
MIAQLAKAASILQFVVTISKAKADKNDFVQTGLGPMQGQANHFYRYAPEKIQYGIDRYINETRRLYRVLDTQLEKNKSGFIVGDHVSRPWCIRIPYLPIIPSLNPCLINRLTRQISLADLTTYGWVYYAGWAGVDIDEFPNVKAWEERLTARPAIDKGKDIPKKLQIKERMKDPKYAEEVAQKARGWM